MCAPTSPSRPTPARATSRSWSRSWPRFRCIERPDPERSEERHQRHQPAADSRRSVGRPFPSLCLLVPPAPVEDRLGEDVVEELVARTPRRRGGGTRRRMRPLSPGRACRARPRPRGSGRFVQSARSEAGWAIFVFERVTRKRKRSAATACSSRSSAPSASSRWFSTIRCGAAERLEPGERQRGEPAATVARQSRSRTS